MKLYESAEDYLETILILSKQDSCVHAINIAHHLNFSKASVSVAIHKLEDNDLVTIEQDGCIKLTSKGRKIAESVYERHIIISEALMKIGVSKEQALEDACKIEHDISIETFDAIKQTIK